MPARTMSPFRLATTWLRSRVLRDRTARWNHQYATGRWEKLKGPAERARFDATARLLARHAPAGDMLEIGCGEALLQQRMAPDSFRSWIGIDLAEVAVARAQAFAGGSVRYFVADMETFGPGVKFDAIVFTESIYYSKGPARLLRRYASFLKPGGVLVVSIFRTKRSAAVWAQLHAVATVLDSASTIGDPGTWDCEVLACKAG